MNDFLPIFCRTNNCWFPGNWSRSSHLLPGTEASKRSVSQSNSFLSQFHLKIFRTLERRILTSCSARVKDRFYEREKFFKAKLREALCASEAAASSALPRRKCNKTCTPPDYDVILRFWSEHHNGRQRASSTLCKSRHTHTRTHKGKEGRCVRPIIYNKVEDRQQQWEELEMHLRPTLKTTLKVQI